MKTAIIGGGKGCRAILELAIEGRLKTISLQVMCVVDHVEDAPGMVYARQRKIPTLESIHTAVRLPGLDLILEVTGRDDVLEQIYQLVPPGVRVMDHVLARVFWDVEQAEFRLREELVKTRNLERQVEQDRRALQEILDSIPDMVFVIGRDMRIERTNARFEEMTGIRREEAIGRKCCDIYCRTDPDEIDKESGCPFLDVMRTDRPVSLIRYYPPSDDKDESYHEVTATPIRDENGDISRVVKTSRPITEQVRLKRETEENEQRFRQFLDAAYDLIVMKDLGGRYLFINQQAAGMLGKSPEDFIGRTDPDVLPARLARRIMSQDRKVMEEMRYISREERLYIEGREYYLDTVRFPLTNYKDDVIGVASISRDITGNKRLERELVESERLAAVGKLAAGVAHELNNPLTGILTFTEGLLMEAEPEDPRREDYDVIMRETMRCRQIVRDLLDYSRLESPKRETSDLNRLVERAVSLVAKQAEFHDVKFNLELSESLPPVSVDPNQVQQVILNLVINAKDAMKKTGTITLRTYSNGGKKGVVIEVADQGVGIPPEQMKIIFEPFYTTKGVEGNGLGLPVVKSIVEQHGGEVKVDSEPGKGTSFYISLPAAVQKRGEEAHE